MLSYIFTNHFFQPANFQLEEVERCKFNFVLLIVVNFHLFISLFHFVQIRKFILCRKTAAIFVINVAFDGKKFVYRIEFW